MSVTRDPLAALARFTPAAPGIDRDELLFRAGRASARPRRLWPVLAAVLAVTNAVTLGAWWAGPRPTAVPPPVPVAPSPPDGTLTVAAGRRGELPPPPGPAAEPLVPTGRPWTLATARNAIADY